mgnify:CR=1 FL=1
MRAENDVATKPAGSDEGGSGDVPEVRPRVLTALLDKAVADHPDWPALDFMGREWSYAELDREVARAAAGLERLGLKRASAGSYVIEISRTGPEQDEQADQEGPGGAAGDDVAPASDHGGPW